MMAVKKITLLTFVFSSVFFPMMARGLNFVMLASALLIVVFVLADTINNNFKLRRPAFFNVVIIYVIIYLLVFTNSLYRGNDLHFILQDSFGFLLYLMLPFIIVFVYRNNCFYFLNKLILYQALIISIISVFAVILYFLYFKTLNKASLDLANDWLKALGLTWSFGASDGFLRVNSKSGHYFLLAITLSFIKYLTSKRFLFMYLSVFFVFAAILDGHRSLLVSILIVILTFFVILASNYKKYKFATILITTSVTVVFISIVIYLADYAGGNKYLERVKFDGGSTSLRVEQMYSLVDEISDSPIIGKGFGSSASMIRSNERPYMYEVDHLAVIMKLGIPLAAVYFSIFLIVGIYPSLKFRKNNFFLMSSCAVAYFIYSGSNGGFAMSPITALFHIIFLTVLTGYITREKLCPDVHN